MLASESVIQAILSCFILVRPNHFQRSRSFSLRIVGPKAIRFSVLTGSLRRIDRYGILAESFRFLAAIHREGGVQIDTRVSFPLLFLETQSQHKSVKGGL